MAISEHFVISLQIAGKTYRLRIKRRDEKAFRDAAKEIERKIRQYKNYFSGPDQKDLEELDYVVMTAIQALSEHFDLDSRNKMFENKIKALTTELDEYLKR
ncbi:cell division protein ZapA [Dysgonomonas sp. 216]|uniref:cell division protein ZapA n=1 Tax=Dysgonomonas sp. 216 TaxID=2302934 RepID=UPI0013D092A9|nr:cell division protein ZapA [Dysgonomonas sp. 216]NDW18035.1 cell division protein ZapA [Dysgonomonas sp. 216]